MKIKLSTKVISVLLFAAAIGTTAVLAQSNSYPTATAPTPTPAQTTTTTTTTTSNSNTNSANTTTSTTTTTQPAIKVSAAQVTAAGFTGVKEQPASGTSFQSPVFYFRADQTITGQGATDWAGTSNLIAVFITPKVSPDWTFNNGQPKITEINGRTQVQMTDAGYYIVVTGPDQAKVTALANEVAKVY